MHLGFYAEFQNGSQKWQGIDFGEKRQVDSAVTLGIKNFVEIALSRTVFKINAFLHFTKKFKMATKNDGKTILNKKWQMNLLIPWR